MATREPTIESDDHVRRSKSKKKKIFHLKWLSYNVEKFKKDFSQSFTNLENITRSFETFTDADQFMDSLYENDQKNVIMVASGAFGESTVPIAHDTSGLDSIYIFCHQKAPHEKWAKNYSKVKGIYEKIDEMCYAIKQFIETKDGKQSRKTVILAEPTSADRRGLSPELTHRKASDRDKTTAVPSDQTSSDHHVHTPHRASGRDKPRVTDDQLSRDRSHHGHLLTGTPVEVDLSPTRPIPETTEQWKKKPDRKPKNDNQHDSTAKHGNGGSHQLRSFSPAKDTRSYSPERPSRNLKQLQNTLYTVTEQKLRESLLTNTGIDGLATLNKDSIDQLQTTLMQTIQKRAPTKTDDPNLLQSLFDELKQTLVNTLLQQQQQQPAVIQDLIKQAVDSALKEQQKPTLPATTIAAGLSHHRKPMTITSKRDVKIVADPKKTRTDPTFRKQRDAVIADKRLRAAVQQWSTIGSMADLANAIKTCGKTDLERAWLVFCWIGENIKYIAHCNINAAEKVFRTKQGVCRGFASLYHECCTLLNIECSELSGYARQSLVKSNEDLKKSPHAWNSIVLDNHSYLVDPTWGAGGRDNENKLEDFYFLTSPEEFIYSHYSNGSQLLDPEITKQEFLSLPVMKSTYYELGLQLLSPKQGFNEINGNLFKIVLRAPEHVNLMAQLKVCSDEYPRSLHTLCQRDETQADVYNCYISPPVDGFYDIEIFGKTNTADTYRDAISMRLCVSNIVEAFTFPITYSTFTEHKCILVEPLQRLVYLNEDVLIHMIIPKANVIKIQNGDDHIVPTRDEYKGGILKKKVRVQGNLQVCGRWDDNADSISIICVFHMV